MTTAVVEDSGRRPVIHAAIHHAVVVVRDLEVSLLTRCDRMPAGAIVRDGNYPVTPAQAAGTRRKELRLWT